MTLVLRAAPSFAATTHARRLAKALELLRDDCFDALITGEIPFDDLPAALPAFFAPGAAGLTSVARYA